MTRWMRLASALVAGVATISPALAQDPTASLTKGKPELKSAGALAFGPDGILFVGDTAGAAVFALDTGDRSKDEGSAIEVAGLHEKLAGLLGTEARNVVVNDLAVNPASGRVYLSVARGRGPDAQAAIARVDRAGKVTLLETDEIPFAKAEIPNPPDPNAERRGQKLRNQAITDLVFTDGRVYVAGLSNEEFSSRLLAIPFPFEPTLESAGLEIYHGAHGRFETQSPIRTFIACELKGEPYIMAAYTCTPLVKIPAAALKKGGQVKGTTIAELGNRNNPLDMVAYEQDGKDYLLLANSSRGVMKIDASAADAAEGIANPIKDKAGLGYETIEALKGVAQLDRLDAKHAVILVQAEDGSIDLKTIELP